RTLRRRTPARDPHQAGTTLARPGRSLGRRAGRRVRLMVVTMSAVPGRPPASGVDEFVGRDRELDDLRPLVRRRRLVTLTGPAGVGKTRLAVELIPLVGRSYRGGLWWVELAPLPAGSVVTAAVATVLGREEPGRDLADTLLKACVDGLVLLVLD